MLIKSIFPGTKFPCCGRCLSSPPVSPVQPPGRFWFSFRKSYVATGHKTCNECLLKSKCIYSYIFEISPPEGSEKLRNIESIPRPYIIDPPAFDSTAVYSPERPLRFYLNLIGKAVEYFPYFIVAFQELGKVGIGRRKEKFIIQEVEIQDIATGNLEQIYFPNGTVLNKRYIFSLEDALKQVNKKDYTAIKIDFLSPVRLKAGSYRDIPVFRHFFGSLLRRLSSLSYFHCNTELKISYANTTQLNRSNIRKSQSLKELGKNSYADTK
jgi:hypothetical protein